MKTRNENELENNRIHIHQSESEVGQFKKKEEKHHKKMPYLLILFFVWIIIFFGSVFLVVSYDKWEFSLAWELKYASLNIQNFYQFVLGNGGSNGIDVKVYQYLVVAIVGAALSACGAAFQGGFRNILAGPSSMGVMSGGSLGLTVYLFLFGSASSAVVVTTADSKYMAAYNAMTIWQRYQEQFAILLGCFGAVLLVTGIAYFVGKGKMSASAMIISGMVLSSVIGNITMLYQYYMIMKDPSDQRIQQIRDVMMGSFDNASSLPVLAMMGIPLIICIALLALMSGKLNLLSFGTEEAVAMGLNVTLYRNLMILLNTIITAVVVAFCGHVGFIGFMVPLIARKIAGPDLRKLIPTAILTGAILLTVIFDVAYFLTLTGSMNLITSSIGCILMAIILVKRGGRKNAFEQRRGPAGMGFR